jgi:hypothetical protein
MIVMRVVEVIRSRARNKSARSLPVRSPANLRTYLHQQPTPNFSHRTLTPHLFQRLRERDTRFNVIV